MKNIFRAITLAVFVIFASCSKDDTKDQQAVNQETIPLAANTVSDNVIIKGGIKEEGMPPVPNEAITLDIANSGKAAFLNEGFEINLKSNVDIVGAYLQFQDESGTVSNNYYDIDLTENSSSGKANTTSAKGDEFTLNVGFNSAVNSGIFCYIVCVYDGQGNISAPLQVCTTVESWGGNSDLVGTWNYTKKEVTEDGETKIVLVGENGCNERSISCEDKELFYEDCTLIEYQNFTLNKDGTFTFEYKNVINNLDFGATFAECEPIFKEEYVFIEKFEGFWAYREAESSLSLVFYEQVRITDGEVENRSFENGEGIVLSDTPIELNGKTLVRIITRDTDEDGINDYTFKTFSEKAN
ncbi:hypothetical protein [Cellulophaga sp. Z1A5H]|uniref:hypothetical protein n=1 Tax=Cellulophaga sp. Z1A5H TaxID=2687291 RepID=UPI0013FD21D8|nr:hypothetical protein [Cellulophaga sp. Z1A5H]